MKKTLTFLTIGLFAFGVWAAEVNDLNVTDASNTARFPENMAPSAVNDGARALEGIVARWDKDINGSLDSLGAADAYTVSANRTLTALYDGLTIAFEVTVANSASATLNVDSLGAKEIKKLHDQSLVAGDLEDGQKIVVIYDSDAAVWQLQTPTASMGVGNVIGPASATDGGLATFDGVTGELLKDGPITGTGSGNVPLVGTKSSTESLAGLVEKSTSAENVTGTDDTVWPTVAGTKEMIDTHAASGPTLATPQATTSGTTFDFTGIPSGTKMITVMFNAVSLTGLDEFLIQIGDAGGIETGSYVSRDSNQGGSMVTSTSGFITNPGAAAFTMSGAFTLTLENATTFTWVSRHNITNTQGNMLVGAGIKSLSAELTQVRVTRDGTNTFDAGEINIQYQ